MFLNEPEPKPKEWLHHQDCMATALISSVQNVRDSAVDPLDFRILIQAGEILGHADELLLLGMQSCTCPDGYAG